MHDVFGRNLLHASTRYCRPDVYRLLLHHGLKPGHLDSWILHISIRSTYSSGGNVRQIDMLRLLLVHQPEVFEHFYFAFRLVPTLLRSRDCIEWLWHNVTCILPNEEVIALRSCLLQMVVRNICVPIYLLRDERVIERIERFLEIKMKEHYLCIRGHFMESLFADTNSSLESSEIGSRFIDLLSRLGFDVEAFMRSELDRYHNISGYFPWGMIFDHRKKIIFEPADKGGWLLRWEWVLDSCLPGYLVVSEHIALGPDICWPTDWPFDIGEHKFYYSDDEHDQQFERRMNNKARKQRAKAKRKRGTRVPGAWV
ncbi:hypothetical protein BDU57DRAFT_37565 [Ampelomyces quisqualis]|uniref:Ankyrin repeat-containing domain protein n=1 Tax=Ampelomyces quisqualis TaxID=50730 RepID=A0A6A5R0A1_AMPQU|nr:hypothetical protein BDU57DRAFT_37565 [Ampelomyces quisqualis]